MLNNRLKLIVYHLISNDETNCFKIKNYIFRYNSLKISKI